MLINNVCYVFNVVNVCWGSFYDVLYGIDVISNEGGVEVGKSYNFVCGVKVVVKVKDYLDSMIFFVKGSYVDVIEYKIELGKLVIIFVDGDEIILVNIE